MPGFAGVVLAGGRSTRMGSPKAALEWHGSTLLRRTAGILGRFGPVVVVRAAGQHLPALPAQIRVVDDAREGKGPVQGIATGLAAIGDQADFAFVVSTDLPFLHPAFVRRMLHAAADAAADVALPLARGFPQPLAAAYRTTLAAAAERLAAADRLRPAFLFDECSVLRLDDAALLTDPALAAFDPALDSVLNVNEPAGYRAARERPPPEVTVELLGTLAAGAGGPVAVRAATVGEAADAIGVALSEHVVAALNGEAIAGDAHEPLAAGDTVFFLAEDAGADRRGIVGPGWHQPRNPA